MSGATIASLGFDVDSAGLVKGTSALDGFTKAGSKAETAAEGVGSAIDKAAAKAASGSKGIDRLFTAIERVEKAIRDQERALNAMGASTDKLFQAYQAIDRSSTVAAGGLQKVSAAALQTNDNVEKVVRTATNAAEVLGRINRVTGASRSSSPVGRAEDIAAYGASLDGLRAKYNPLFATIRQYQAVQADIRKAHSQGAISTDEMTAALARQRTEALRNIAALKGRKDVIEGGANDNNGSFRRRNSMYQITDIGQGVALGMPLSMVAMQQVPQLAQNHVGEAGGGMKAVKEDLAALRSGAVAVATSIAGILGPVGLVGAGIAAVSVGAIAYFARAGQGAKTLEDRLDAQRKAIEGLADGWKLVENSISGAAKEAQSILSFQSMRATEGLRKGLEEEFTRANLTARFASAGMFGGSNIFTEYKEVGLEEPIRRLLDQVEAGQVDIVKFNNELSALGNAPGASSELKKRIDEIFEFTRALGDAQRAVQAFDRNIGPGGLLRGGSEYNRRDMGSYEKWRQEEESRLRRSRDAAQVDIDAIGARSPSQLAEIARRREAGIFNDTESGNERRLRIETAATQALKEAQYSLSEAQRERVRSLNESVEAQRNELALVGRTTASTAALRMEYDLTTRVREEAARNGVAADQKELDLIKQKAAEYGRLAAQQEALARIQDQKDQIDLAQAELASINLIGPARERAFDAAKAELDIRKMGIDLYSQEANAIRANVAALLDLREAKLRADLVNDIRFDIEQMGRSPSDAAIAQQLRDTGIGMDDPIAGTLREMERVNRLRDGVRGFFDDMRSGLTSGDSIGDAIKQGIMRSLNSASDKLWDQGMEALMRAFFPAPAAPSSSFTSTMNGFANVIYGANDNAVSAAITAAGPSSVNARSMSGTVAQQAFSFFKSKGLSDVGAAAMVGQAHAESGFNPNAIGDGGLAHGLFQHHPNRGGNQALIASGVQGQLEHAWKELQGPERGVLTRLQSATTARDATRAAIGFERPAGWSAANPEAGHNFAGRLSATEQALSRFGGTSEKAVKAVDEMTTGALDAGKGLGQLASAFPAAPNSSGGGAGNWFSNLFGGGRATFASMSAISPLAASHIAGNGKLGLYASGTENAPEGWAWVGEEGPELRKLRAGDVIRTHPRSLNMAANARAATRTNADRSGGSSAVHVTLGWEQGSNGNIEPVVRGVVQRDAPGIARQEASGVVQANNDEMPRAGFGEAQRRYNAMRG